LLLPELTFANPRPKIAAAEKLRVYALQIPTDSPVFQTERREQFRFSILKRFGERPWGGQSALSRLLLIAHHASRTTTGQPTQCRQPALTA
jgi:hypothetical protein